MSEASQSSYTAKGLTNSLLIWRFQHSWMDFADGQDDSGIAFDSSSPQNAI